MIRRTATAASVAFAAFAIVAAACTTNGATDSTNAETSDSTKTCVRLFVEDSRPALAAGCYQLSFYANPGVEVPDASVEVPSGYEHETTWWVVSHDGHEFLGLWTVGLVDHDACRHGEDDSFDPGPSVDDMADALVAQKSTRASAPEPVTLAGHHGLYVEVAGPRDLSRCDDPQAGLWNDPGGRGIYGGGQVDRVWILDVDGQRLVVDAAYSPKSTASDRDDLSAMVESLRFVEE